MHAASCRCIGIIAGQSFNVKSRSRNPLSTGHSRHKLSGALERWLMTLLLRSVYLGELELLAAVAATRAAESAVRAGVRRSSRIHGEAARTARCGWRVWKARTRASASSPPTPGSRDPVTAFLHHDGAQWHPLAVGTAFEFEMLHELGVPESLHRQSRNASGACATPPAAG
jgi:hypothetical protein